jgi:hypothetical protein
MCEFFMYPNPFREALFTEPYRPVNGVITLTDKPGFGVSLMPDLEKQFPYVPGPMVTANPRFPHALARANIRQQQVQDRYARPAMR